MGCCIMQYSNILLLAKILNTYIRSPSRAIRLFECRVSALRCVIVFIRHLNGLELIRIIVLQQ